MGWKTKGLLTLVAIALFGTAAWWIGALILVGVVYSLRPRRRRPRAVLVAPPGYAVEGPPGAERADYRRRGARLEWRWRYFLGVLFLFGALVAISEHGTFSPLVFGGLGALCFLWAPLSRGGRLPSAGYSPMRESTLLRNSVLPLSWITVVELKLSSQESARALSVLRDDLVVVAPPGAAPAAYLVVRERAAGYASAEARVAERLRNLAAVLASRGVYLLPLDSEEAARRFGSRLAVVRMDLDRDGVFEVVGHYPYDVLVVRPDGVHAKCLGAYRLERPGGDADLDGLVAGNPSSTASSQQPGPPRVARLPTARRSFARPPLLWEVVSCLQERFRFAEPDAYTMFLNNMHVSRGVPPAAKMSLVSRARGSGNSSTLSVESLGGAPVDATRAQLRAIVKIYG